MDVPESLPAAKGAVDRTEGDGAEKVCAGGPDGGVQCCDRSGSAPLRMRHMNLAGHCLVRTVDNDKKVKSSEALLETSLSFRSKVLTQKHLE